MRFLAIFLCGVFSLAACTPIAVIGGAAGAGTLLMSSDRRSEQTKGLDSAIESGLQGEINKALNGFGSVKVTSYFKKVLLTGSVPDLAGKNMVEQIARVFPNNEGVFNEVEVLPNAGIGQYSSDALLSSKVRSRFAGQNGLPSSSVRVVSERDVVYLMGRLTKTEAELAAKVASQTSGVSKVVTIIDFIDPAWSQTKGVITTGSSE